MNEVVTEWFHTTVTDSALSRLEERLLEERGGAVVEETTRENGVKLEPATDGTIDGKKAARCCCAWEGCHYYWRQARRSAPQMQRSAQDIFARSRKIEPPGCDGSRSECVLELPSFAEFVLVILFGYAPPHLSTCDTRTRRALSTVLTAMVLWHFLATAFGVYGNKSVVVLVVLWV